MRLLCLSNGHGEDAIALRILQALQQQPDPPELTALPIVGAGQTYVRHGIPLAGAVKAMPSGGFIYMDGRQLARDLQGGLLSLTRLQLQTVRHWAKAGGVILAVGDIVPLLFAWWSGLPYVFVGTAKSEYHLRDEQGALPRASWLGQLESRFGSVYQPWERWLMRHPRCKAVFPRDALTAQALSKWAIPAFDLGNPMMDGLEPVGVKFGEEQSLALTVALLPGSRPPEAYENWQIMLEAVAALLAAMPERILFLAAIAPTLEPVHLQIALAAQGWQSQGWQSQGWQSIGPDPVLPQTFTQEGATLILTQAFNDCLHQADLAIAMAGTATEQFVGLGKPVITFPGRGPQFTPKFAEAQTRLLGISVILLDSPAETARVLPALLEDSCRLQQIQENGYHRMGEPGAAQRIADRLRLIFSLSSIQG